MSTAPAILVTGGASGIGFAVVEAVLAEGWRAICADVSERNLASAREQLGDRAELRLERFDVADEDAVVRAVAACDSEFGPLAGVVNSAGIAQRPTNTQAVIDASAVEGYLTIPSWDLLTTQDHAIDPDLQRFMAARAKARITEVASSHAVMVSHPDAVAAIIEQAARWPLAPGRVPGAR